MSSYRRTVGILLTLALVAVSPVRDARGADALADAKRKAAADLMRDGKTADAVALTLEVIRGDPDNYRDHLLLARAYDKQNKPQEAVDAYRRVLATLAPADDRAVRAEAERRLKVLDVQMIKIQAAEDEFLKRLDALEREAIAAKDVRGVERTFRLKGAIYTAERRGDAFGSEIQANVAWQECGPVLTAGRRYRYRVVGTWTIHPGRQCGPNGVPDLPPVGRFARGALTAKLSSGPEIFGFGDSGIFIPPASGKLLFITNMSTHEDRVKNSGYVFILFEPG